MVSMALSTLIAVAAFEFRKPLALLLNAGLGGFAGALFGGWYLGVSGGLGGFNDNILIMVPVIIGPITGFMGPGMMKVFLPRLFKGVAIPSRLRNLSGAITVLVIVSGLLLTAIFLVPDDGYVTPGSGTDICGLEGRTSSMMPGLKQASSVYPYNDIQALNGQGTGLLGDANPYDIGIDLFKSAAFLSSQPRVGDTLEFHARATVQSGSPDWVKPAMTVVIWHDDNGNGMIDQTDSVAPEVQFKMPSGGYNSMTTIRPIVVYRDPGNGALEPSYISGSGYLATPSVWKRDTGVAFPDEPGGLTLPCDCFTTVWPDSNNNMVMESSEYLQTKENANQWISKGPGGYVEFYGKLLVTQEMYSQGSTWHLTVSAKDLNYDYSENIRSEDHVFTVLPAEDIPDPVSMHIISPNGGETITKGGAYTISWTSTSQINQRLSLYRGSTVQQMIGYVQPGSGSYSWQVLESSQLPPGSDYRVKLWDDNGNYDYSDGYFTIADPVSDTVAVTSPNGGETWEIGGTYPISWTASNPSDSFSIELWKGSVFSATMGGTHQGSGSWQWTIPSTVAAGSDYRMRIVSSGTGTNDYSDMYFTIATGDEPVSIHVDSPNGGEAWKKGTTQVIAWTSTSEENQYIYIHKGTEYFIVDQVSMGSGIYSWTIGSRCPWDIVPGQGYLVEVKDMSGNSDMSDSWFTIAEEDTPVTGPEITVTSPNGGETWDTGSSYDIAWTSTGGVTGNIYCHLYKGSVQQRLITVTENTGSYQWSIPGDIAEGQDYRIRVTDSEGTSDLSDGYFTLEDMTEPPPDDHEDIPGEDKDFWDLGFGQIENIIVWGLIMTVFGIIAGLAWAMMSGRPRYQYQY